MSGISAVIKGPQWAPSPLLPREGSDATHQSGGRRSPDSESAGTLILSFPAPGMNCENECLSFKPPSLCCLVLAA